MHSEDLVLTCLSKHGVHCTVSEMSIASLLQITCGVWCPLTNANVGWSRQVNECSLTMLSNGF